MKIVSRGAVGKVLLWIGRSFEQSGMKQILGRGEFQVEGTEDGKALR